MLSKAKSKYVKVSPTKLRFIADSIRGKRLDTALAALKVFKTKRIKPLEKVLLSAYANANDTRENQDQVINLSDVVIKELRVDQGPVIKYFKPGAMGRACVQRKKMSHISVALAESK